MVLTNQESKQHQDTWDKIREAAILTRPHGWHDGRLFRNHIQIFSKIPL